MRSETPYEARRSNTMSGFMARQIAAPLLAAALAMNGAHKVDDKLVVTSARNEVIPTAPVTGVSSYEVSGEGVYGDDGQEMSPEEILSSLVFDRAPDGSEEFKRTLEAIHDIIDPSQEVSVDYGNDGFVTFRTGDFARFNELKPTDKQKSQIGVGVDGELKLGTRSVSSTYSVAQPPKIIVHEDRHAYPFSYVDFDEAVIEEKRCPRVTKRFRPGAGEPPVDDAVVVLDDGESAIATEDAPETVTEFIGNESTLLNGDAEPTNSQEIPRAPALESEASPTAVSSVDASEEEREQDVAKRRNINYGGGYGVAYADALMAGLAQWASQRDVRRERRLRDYPELANDSLSTGMPLFGRNSASRSDRLPRTFEPSWSADGINYDAFGRGFRFARYPLAVGALVLAALAWRSFSFGTEAECELPQQGTAWTIMKDHNDWLPYIDRDRCPTPVGHVLTVKFDGFTGGYTINGDLWPSGAITGGQHLPEAAVPDMVERVLADEQFDSYVHQIVTAVDAARSELVSEDHDYKPFRTES